MPHDFMGFQAHVWCGGRELVEHDPKVVRNFSRVFIEASEGDNFEIRYKALENLVQHYSILIYVDGICHECHYYGSISGTTEVFCAGRRVDVSMLLPFRFKVQGSGGGRDRLGTVELRFCRFQYRMVASGTSRGFLGDGATSYGDSVAQLGPAEVVPPAPVVIGEYLDFPNNPHFTIQFLYGPRDVLEEVGVIPRAPPLHLTAKAPVHTYGDYAKSVALTDIQNYMKDHYLRAQPTFRAVPVKAQVEVHPVRSWGLERNANDASPSKRKRIVVGKGGELEKDTVDEADTNGEQNRIVRLKLRKPKSKAQSNSAYIFFYQL